MIAGTLILTDEIGEKKITFNSESYFEHNTEYNGIMITMEGENKNKMDVILTRSECKTLISYLKNYCEK